MKLLISCGSERIWKDITDTIVVDFWVLIGVRAIDSVHQRGTMSV